MIRSGAHSGDAAMLAFPAVIVSSEPTTGSDPLPKFLFPRIYEWRACESPQMIAGIWKQVLVPGIGCGNVTDAKKAWATNVSESYYDMFLNNYPVPVGTRVIICFGIPKRPSVHPPDCNPPDIETVLSCNPPSGVWFSHWVDPESHVCNG